MTRLLLAFCLLLSAHAGWAQSRLASYRLDKMMGTPVWGPRDVAVDQRGTIYLADDAVNKLDSTGRFITSFQLPSTASAEALALDAAGNLYVGCVGNSAPGDVIRKYSPDGQLLLRFGTNGSGPGQLGMVSGLCVGPTGILYVVDSNRRLCRFDSQGGALPEIPLPAANGTDLEDIDVDAAGNLYLLYENLMVSKLSPSGQLLARIQLGSAAGGNNSPRAQVLLLDAAGNMGLG